MGRKIIFSFKKKNKIRIIVIKTYLQVKHHDNMKDSITRSRWTLQVNNNITD